MDLSLHGDAATSHKTSIITDENKGLFDNDEEGEYAIREAYAFGSVCNIRNLFASMLLSGSLPQPRTTWENTWHMLSTDILQRQRNLVHNQELKLTDDELKNYVLNDIERILQINGSSLQNFNGMPIPGATLSTTNINNHLSNEFSPDKRELTYENTLLIASMTMEQMAVYDEIMESISKDRGGVFFIYGHAGTGKTFILKALCAALRSKGEIVLPVATSGIAASYLPGGRQAFDVFGIPFDISENSRCEKITHGSPLAEHLRKTKLIIWDEAPMMHKFVFEALDRSLRDVMQTSSERDQEAPFGGKLIVFAGDFRQLLPIFEKGQKDNIRRYTINFSYLWSGCKVLHLTRNMRLDLGSFDIKDDELRKFDGWIKNVGEGTIEGRIGEKGDLYIPDDVLITGTTEPLASIVNSTYPCLKDNLCNVNYFHERAILAPTQTIVDEVNHYIMTLLPGNGKVYSSSGQDEKKEGKSKSTNYKSLQTNTNTIMLKVGAIIMLIRTIDLSTGMCHGTRLMVTALGSHVIRATVISGNNIGVQVYIPRIAMTHTSTSKLPARMKFPFAISFAMAIHKSQAQSLSHVGLYLPKPVSLHGQLYLAISRVNSKNGLKILISDKRGIISNTTTNVVFKDIFLNL